MVPTGTFSTTFAPSRPVLFEPSPWRPRSALYSGLKRKCTSVLWRSLDSMITSPPCPPSPPEGPPRGTNFSRRNAMQPFPPSPALIRIFASSTNMEILKSAISNQLKRKGPAWTRPKTELPENCPAISAGPPRPSAYCLWLITLLLNHRHELAQLAAVLEQDRA